MIYRKNIGSLEQAIRIVIGLLVALGAMWAFPGSFLGYALLAGGAALAFTGLFRFCPMCAMIGRPPVEGR